MEVKRVLSELGLSDGEIGVYLALLKLGSSAVSGIKEETGLHRTTIYDFLEKLLNKGLVNYVIKNNVKYYKASDPHKLHDFLKEKEEHLSQVLPELVELGKFQKEDLLVEVYKGPEGLKTVMLDQIRMGVEGVGIGVDEIKWKKALPVFMDQYQRMLKERGMHERILTKTNPEYLLDQSNTHYKFLPSNFFSPISTMVVGDRVEIGIFEPTLTAIVIRSRELADAFKNHFEVLWNQESWIFRGDDDVRHVFEEIVASCKKGDNYYAFGIPPIPEKWNRYFDDFISRMDKKGVQEYVIMDEDAGPILETNKKYKTVHIRTLPRENMTPAEVDIYGNKMAIILWAKVPQAIVIDNKEIANSFRKYFEILWKIAKPV